MTRFFFSRLIKDGLCDRSTAPSVSAISRLMKGKDEAAETVKMEKGQSLQFLSELRLGPLVIK